MSIPNKLNSKSTVPTFSKQKNFSLPSPTFLLFYGLVNNLFRQQRHLLSATYYRVLRDRAFTVWKQARPESWSDFF
jgi:hypothetical protein